MTGDPFHDSKQPAGPSGRTDPLQGARTAIRLRRLDPASLRPQPRRDGPDAWPTPPCLATVLVADILPRLPAGPIWEPAAGGGALVSAMRFAGHEVIPTDILGRPSRDFLTDAPPGDHFGAIVSNPPFRLLDRFLDRGFDLLRAGVTDSVVWLWRCDHLTAGSRAEALNQAAEVRLCAWRPQWIANTSTSPRWSFEWITWRRDHRGPPMFVSRRRDAESI